MRWAILAVLIAVQDKTPLSWKLQAKDKLLVKSSFTQTADGKSWEYTFETEIEVTGIDGDGAKVIVRVLRSTGKAPDGSYAYDRSKPAEGKLAEFLGADHPAKLTFQGKFIANDRTARELVQATMGYLFGTVPVKNVADGESWKTEEKFKLPGPDAGLFLTHTHQKGGRISVVGTGEGLDGETLEGKGEMQFADGWMKSYSFKVEEKRDGKVINSAEQRVDVELRRP